MAVWPGQRRQSPLSPPKLAPRRSCRSVAPRACASQERSGSAPVLAMAAAGTSSPNRESVSRRSPLVEALRWCVSASVSSLPRLGKPTFEVITLPAALGLRPRRPTSYCYAFAPLLGRSQSEARSATRNQCEVQVTARPPTARSSITSCLRPPAFRIWAPSQRSTGAVLCAFQNAGANAGLSFGFQVDFSSFTIGCGRLRDDFVHQ